MNSERNGGMNECARRGGVKNGVSSGKDGGRDKGIVSGGTTDGMEKMSDRRNTIEVMVIMSDSRITAGSMGGWAGWGVGA